MYKEGIRKKVRFETKSHLGLTIEDLNDLSLSELNKVAKMLKRELNETAEEDYLEEVTKEDAITKLKFDIVLDVIKTKKEENKEKSDKKEQKEKLQKYLEILAEKQDDSIKNMSIEDLQKEIAELTKK